ncbi:hypothetical protein [Archangium sp.]|jgi:hypothetical protein|uniref:hypothetical protein n=1 Tax=Archangium sp. TaxID=1872627 RepID=UPI002ED803D8
MPNEMMLVIENDANDSKKQAEPTTRRPSDEWVMMPRRAMERLLARSQSGDGLMRARRMLKSAELSLTTLGEIEIMNDSGDQPKDPPDDEGAPPPLVVAVMAPTDLVLEAERTLRKTRTSKRSRVRWHTRASANLDTGTLAMKADVLEQPPETAG